mgnify:CR=1 FL=1
MIWVTVEDVIAVHSRIIKGFRWVGRYSGPKIVWKAAVNAPLQTFAGFDLFETDLAKIARIGFGLAPIMPFLMVTNGLRNDDAVAAEMERLCS